MTRTNQITLAYSSCPNDTFIFKAIAKGLINLEGLKFDICIEDVETLNQQASYGRYDVTKLSVAAFGNLTDQYRLLRSGAALGKVCGPLLITAPGRTLSGNQNPVIAVPGLGTTARHLLEFFMADQFPNHCPQLVPMTFDRVMPAVLDKTCDFGVIIHEGRFVYQESGLGLVVDLGQWWEDTTGMPIPLGCIAVKKKLDGHTAQTVQKIIQESIHHAFLNPLVAYDYIRGHAQELSDQVIAQHIDLYVNDFSKDLGDEGEKAIRYFFEYAHKTGLLPDISLSIVPGLT